MLAVIGMAQLIDRGGTADVLELPQGRVLKAFRRRAHTNDIVTEWNDHDAITRAQFRAEARAYEQLQVHRSLEIYVPCYFGRIDPIEVLQLPASDETYVRGCGLILERIPGCALKLAHVDDLIEEKVSIVMEELRDTLGLDQVWDASCFVPGTRAPFTVIDFALWNAEEYEIELSEGGRLTDIVRAKLEREHAI